jgi:hypothetical protein
VKDQEIAFYTSQDLEVCSIVNFFIDVIGTVENAFGSSSMHCSGIKEKDTKTTFLIIIAVRRASFLTQRNEFARLSTLLYTTRCPV